jgi:co-chaperonin GroES (HSP10)
MSMTEGDFASINPKGFRAHDNHVIVSIAKPKLKTEGGLHVPGGGLKPEPGVGIVISIGHGVERLNLGDKITWKDTMVFTANSQKVTADSAVYLDLDNHLVCVRKDMIIAVRNS